jgi:acyl carrier protein
MKKKIKFTQLELKLANLFKVKKNDLKKDKVNILKNLDSLDIFDLLYKLQKMSKNKIKLSNLMKFKNFQEVEEFINK